MPDIKICGEQDFLVYDSMSDDDLKKLLRDDFSKQEGEETDTDLLLYITELLAKRREEKNEGKTPAEAWESFERNYHPENDDPYIFEKVPAVQKRTGSGRWKWGRMAVAAMLVIVIGTTVTARALKPDLWGVVAQWTKETFYLASVGRWADIVAPNRLDVHMETELRALLSMYGVTEDLAPTWFPDGYKEVSVATHQTAERRIFTAQYRKANECIHIKIANYLPSSPGQYEQTGFTAEVYTSNGVDYYIFWNYERLVAVWINEGYECMIAGPLSVPEMKKMIDSIEKG